MKIEFYKSLKDKESHFSTQNIDSKEDLDSFINDWETKENQIFRGVNNASFKLYNSSQRFWIGEELQKLGKSYPDFIKEQIENAKKFQNNVLEKFYKSFGHEAYDLSVLSFLQHYGAPTPLLDFSYNLNTALYFATENTPVNHIKDDIDNYISIYAIDLSKTKMFFPSLIDHLSSNTRNINEILERYKGENIDTSGVTEPLKKLSYSYFEKLSLFYIPGYSEDGYEFEIPELKDFKLIFNQQNLNIINQEGLFVYNSDETHPLEDYFTDDNDGFQKTFVLPKIKCWNIHKSFQDYIISNLNKAKPCPVNKAFIYPQEEMIASDSFKKFKTNI
ncbi:FRG domain-containing protein [Polaribacter sp. Z014]|uniref:FRG domain-containing protein n=1 Tax=Polaribacter sp. Z014 TaxID=2927126 RepID=UPI00201FE0A2|nr:FRG domain-containing protein [Polaribacter sp. Z014]MCL7765443.1 FRG domain-containing protein [Polaribacter sp. Z014]